MENSKIPQWLRNKKIIIPIASILLITLLSVFVVKILEADGVRVTRKYNKAIEEYNLLVEEYNHILDNCSIDNLSGLFKYEKLETVSEKTSDIKKSLASGNTVKKIKSDTKTIKDMTDELEQDIKIVNQIVNPTEEWVIKRLSNIENITDKAGVTSKTDKNGMLGKEGGYTSCVYFGLSTIDASHIEGEDIVAKGADAGGAIEVYVTVEDAEARCEYLAEYDNTLLYSGSYAIVGTMVIRTSYKLTPEEQLDMTNRITMEFTKLY